MYAVVSCETTFFLIFVLVFKAYAVCPNIHGGALIERSNIDSSVSAVAVNTGSPITCDGYITGWRFVPSAMVEFVALVMRPHLVADGKYTIVGRTTIPAQDATGHAREYTLQEYDWIAVKTGDVIGFHFGTPLLTYDTSGGTEFSFCQSVNVDNWLINKIQTINSPENREYAFQAVLKDTYIPCHIISPPILMTSNRYATLLKLWIDDWNKIRCPGKVTGWKFMARNSGEITAVVFRAVDADSAVYEIIGLTTIPGQTEHDVIIEFPLTYSEHINVLPGDKIGFAFTESPLYYMDNLANSRTIFSMYKHIDKPDNFAIGDQLTFATDHSLRKFIFYPILDVEEPKFVHQSVTTIKDSKLQNSNIVTKTSSSLVKCFTECVNNQQCKSVNYNQNQQTCGLNDAASGDFIAESGVTYVEIRQAIENVVSNVCAFVDCGPGNICVEVPNDKRRYLCFCSFPGYLASHCPSMDCFASLGMESRDILDGQISASSMFFNDPTHGAKCSRLNSVEVPYVCVSGWVASTTDNNKWIQVHLMVEHNITGIETQGRNDYNQWVKTYTISYLKLNETGETFVSDGHGVPKIFDGNFDKTTIRTHFFNPVLQAVAVRIYPKSWNDYSSIRIEVLGCRIGSEWVRVFKGVSMTGQSIYNAWVSGSATSTYHGHQFLTSDTFYRNNVIMDSWSAMDIQKVKLTVFSVFNEELFSIIFNGVDSTSSTWFSKDRVESSPWDDLKTGTSDLFSIQGTVGRTFLIHSFSNGCQGDTGWFSVLEGNVCKEWDGYSTNPRIIYSKTNKAEIYFSGHFGTARAITVDVTLGW